MTTDAVYGLLQVGDLDLALPLSALREVVARPPQLTEIPAVAVGLVGALALRATVLPVVDLRPLLARADAGPEDQVVVVVAHDERIVGLVADRVCGVTRVADGDLLPLAAAAGELLVSHVFQLDDARPVSVLDARQLLSLPGVPTVAEQPATGVPAARASQRDERLTMVRCGSQVLGLEVESIHTTIPLADLRPGVLGGGICLGVTTYAGREVAVVDPLALLGLAPLSDEDVRAGVVLELERGRVVLAVTDLVELRSVDSGVLPVPAFAHLRPELVRGVVEFDGSACPVLDGAGLRADLDLGSLAALNVEVGAEPDAVPNAVPDAGAAGAGRRDGRAAAWTGAAHLTYRAGTMLTSPLDQVVEVLPRPAVLGPSSVEQVAGVMVHRGHAVPVVSLPALLGQVSGQDSGQVSGRESYGWESSSCLLLVGSGSEQVALAVDALGGIEPLEWTDPDHRPRPMDDLTRAVADAPLARLAGETRLLPLLDLDRLAEVLGATLAQTRRPLHATAEPSVA